MRLQVAHSDFDLTPGVSFSFPDGSEGGQSVHGGRPLAAKKRLSSGLCA